MSAYELPNGNLMVRVNPKAPGPAGAEEREIGPDHPEWDYWYDLAEREAVYGAWMRVRTLEEVKTAERGVDRLEAKTGPDHKGRKAADVATARAMLRDRRRYIERQGEGSGG